MASRNLADYPFYRERLGPDGQPAPWTLADLENYAAAHPGDPFAGRVIGQARPAVSLQMEATDEPPIWTGLNPPELDRWAEAVARMWSRWGAVAGETIAFFDYGSSPMVLLASGGYVGYLRRGAAERLGIFAVCNDGVATMAPRMAGIVQTVKPAMLVLRRDLIAPFAAALETAGVALAASVRWAAMSEVEGAVSREQAEAASASLGVRVFRILRCDAIFLLAGECPECRYFHLDSRYQAEELPSGEVAITTTFAATCPSVRYNLGVGRLTGRGCPLEPRAQRIEC
jgi:phenylacetate-coenzyme A ligase PaaK-like adenylate-forming protein